MCPTATNLSNAPADIGGSVKDPTYKQVCSGTTGHAEAVEITFDPAIVTYQDLLNVFWERHDPTTRNRQGNDVGTQVSEMSPRTVVMMSVRYEDASLTWVMFTTMCRAMLVSFLDLLHWTGSFSTEGVKQRAWLGQVVVCKVSLTLFVSRAVPLFLSGIFYHSEAQKKLAEESKEAYNKVVINTVVTEITPASTFYAAEDYHQQYLQKGGQSATKGDATPIRCYG